MFPNVITVVAGSKKPGRCRYCHKPIAWVTTASEKHRPARTLPFDTPTPWPLNVIQNAETRVTFEVWPKSALHFTTCQQQPERRRRAVTRSARA